MINALAELRQLLAGTPLADADIACVDAPGCSFSTIGKRNASVLPEPVSDRSIMSA